MTASTPTSNLGQHVFGLSALAFGVIALLWHDSSDPHPQRYLIYAASAALVVGGAIIQYAKTAKIGAAILLAASLLFTLLTVPGIISAPRIYNSWGNFFEQFSLVVGAGLVYARLSSTSRGTLNRVGRILLAVCTISFALEQAFYLNATAQFVPQWVPPGQMFWAVATTVFFALAALALLANQITLLAARLLTIMVVSFGLLVWVPLVLSKPHSHTNWSEIAENFEIAGAVWVLADILREPRHSIRPSR
jgi:hypothetical protein